MTDAVQAVLDQLQACTRVFITPRYSARDGFTMQVSVFDGPTKLAQHDLDFTHCSRLLELIRQQGFITSQVDGQGITLKRRE